MLPRSMIHSVKPTMQHPHWPSRQCNPRMHSEGCHVSCAQRSVQSHGICPPPESHCHTYCELAHFGGIASTENLLRHTCFACKHYVKICMWLRSITSTLPRSALTQPTWRAATTLCGALMFTNARAQADAVHPDARTHSEQHVDLEGGKEPLCALVHRVCAPATALQQPHQHLLDAMK